MPSDDALKISILIRRARSVLLTSSIAEKARLTRSIHHWWFHDAVDHGVDASFNAQALQRVVTEPNRPHDALRVSSSKTKPLGKGASLGSRIAILHSLAHIESWAIDVSWDVINRFGESRSMPRAFYDDFVRIACDEARHHELLAARLCELGISYGELETHDGLWQSAEETSESLEARLAIEHAVHEARGLDVIPNTIDKFRRNGDETSARLIEEIIYPEEITHVAAGLRWFKYLHRRDGDGVIDGDGEGYRGSSGGGGAVQDVDVDVVEDEEDTESSSVVRAFHAVVRRHFRGALKPPFNVEARARAGFTSVWYEPLAVKP